MTKPKPYDILERLTDDERGVEKLRAIGQNGEYEL